jgi:3-(methylthio)propionyl---CoA ligase
MKRTVIGGSACPPAMIRRSRENYGVHVLHAWGMTEMSAARHACARLQAQAPAGRSAEERSCEAAGQAGQVIFGVDMKIVGDDGGDLPWDGKSFGDLLVRGPWVLREYFKGEAATRWSTTTGAAGSRPATSRRSTPTATCRSPTAART